MIRVLIVDDEASVREGLAEWFSKEGWDAETAGDAEEALRKLGTSIQAGTATAARFDVALLDIRLPGMDGRELHRRIRRIAKDLTVIFMTAYASVDTAVRAMKEGAYDYIVKPFQPDEFTALIRQAVNDKLLITEPVENGSSIVAESRAMKEIVKFVETIADSDAPVILLGESGTGKELLARTIHNLGRRRFFPFVPVNCGAISDTLLESELFGHEKGAFTGAQFRRKGRIELAAGGTLFLDEIGEIPPPMQIALLRVIETHEITRLGGERSLNIDFRVVVATHRDLQQEVRAGRFREDLYYRLNVVPIRIPPLRNRPEEIAPLAKKFLAAAALAEKRSVMSLTPDALNRLRAHSWPGNVRELRNVIDRAVLLAVGSVVDVNDLRLEGDERGANPVREKSISTSPGNLEEVEKAHIERILAMTKGNISQAAKQLGIDRATLYRKIRKYGLSVTRISLFEDTREKG